MLVLTSGSASNFLGESGFPCGFPKGRDWLTGALLHHYPLPVGWVQAAHIHGPPWRGVSLSLSTPASITCVLPSVVTKLLSWMGSSWKERAISCRHSFTSTLPPSWVFFLTISMWQTLTYPSQLSSSSCYPQISPGFLQAGWTPLFGGTEVPRLGFSCSSLASCAFTVPVSGTDRQLLKARAQFCSSPCSRSLAHKATGHWMNEWINKFNLLNSIIDKQEIG